AGAAAVEAAVEVDLPFFGAGVSYRPAWRWEVIRHREELGAIECIPDDVAGPAGLRELLLLRDAVPVLLHGIGLSLGSAEGLDPERLAHVARVAEAVQPPWFSEHIAFTRAGGVEVGHLMPLPFTREAVAAVARNVAELKRTLPGLPVLLENIAYTFTLPDAEMTEPEFVRAVLEESDAYLLLDLENVHANSLNHGYDPYEYLESLPLERAVEVHLAGGVAREGEYADTHTRPVPEESWALLEWLAPRADLKAVIIERDDNLPPFLEMLAEARRAGEILRGAGRPAAEPRR
ncbi:MAG TPA: DUF692 domain-containing protein, partial [Thermoanaerobaculia bacterium]|nr:DUF692 domain-containing protein [Thermoanaerobaculia bacterium]